MFISKSIKNETKISNVITNSKDLKNVRYIFNKKNPIIRVDEEGVVEGYRLEILDLKVDFEG